MNITRRDVIHYTVLPQILPRLRTLFTTGFQHIPYFIALVYGAVRLLPAQHPYLNAHNIGKYGLRHVVAAAAHNLVFSWRNVDQIILFALVLVGIVMGLMQVILLMIAIMAGPVMAAAAPVVPTNFAGLFALVPATRAEHDIAYMVLDMVFGVEGIFNSCVSTVTVCKDSFGSDVLTPTAGMSWGLDPTAGGGAFPTAMHVGLHQMFQIYSIGLLVVAAFIFIYFIMTILAETMQSGTAFGKRYNHVWAPIRMVVAFGLLMPVGSGLNSAQYIVLYAAKYGSNFASNGWVLFNGHLNAAHGGGYKSLLPGEDAGGANLIAVPQIPELGGLLQFMSTAKTCGIAFDRAGGVVIADEQVQMWVVKDPTATVSAEPVGPLGGALSYEDLVTFANGAGTVKFRFGRREETKGNAKYAGFVAPMCGELVLRLTDTTFNTGTNVSGAQILQEMYYGMLKLLWHDMPDNLSTDFVVRNKTLDDSGANPQEPPTAVVMNHTFGFKHFLNQALQSPVAQNILGVSIPAGGAVKLMQDSGRWNLGVELTDKGWAGSAIWYNRIAEMNGAMSTSLLNVPMPLRYPMSLEKAYAEKRKGEGIVNFMKRFEPEPEHFEDPKEFVIALVSWHAYHFWQKGGAMESPHARPNGNAVVDILNALLGTNGLFSMRDNENIHPLAQLSGVGKSLIEASIRNLTNVAVGGVSGAFLAKISEFTGVAAASFSGFLLKFTMITITAGFILFYIVPFLPFIYFMFAFGGWIKGIFEAMVGAPLWALAHIRIDGQGLAGQAAVSGYFLIFEIFLRPILMIFGLIASISTFAALVSVLNLVFDQVVSNVGGFDTQTELTIGAGSKIADMRSVVDQFFFTVMYVIVVYLMGMSSFKLIDLIPNQILRWMGQSITTFNDSQENAAEALAGKATQGAQQTSSAIGGGLGQLAGLGAKK
jgi:hypothetical protein